MAYLAKYPITPDQKIELDALIERKIQERVAIIIVRHRDDDDYGTLAVSEKGWASNKEKVFEL